MKHFQQGILGLFLLVVLTSCQSSAIEQPISDPVLTASRVPKATATPPPSPTLAVAPPARYGHAMAYDSKRQMVVLFGGFLENDTVDNTTWEYDGVTWRQMIPAQSPPPRRLAAMVYDPNREVMVLFGGGGGNGLLDDTWEYDGQTWQEIRIIDPPQLWEIPSMVFAPRRGTPLLFGGTYNETDTWTYVDQTWQPLAIHSPVHDRFITIALVYDQQRQVVVAQPAIRAMDESPVTLELGEENWYVAINGSETDSFPSKRVFVTAAYDSRRGVTVLFGGDYEKETWEYDGSSWQLVHPIQSPPARYFHAMVYDEARGVVILFGGSSVDNITLGDTWEYDGVTWTQR